MDEPLSRPAELLIDQIDALRVLRADTDEEKGRLLEQIGGKGVVEQEMVSQMSAMRPLNHPERFEEAHRIMMRSIEVLDRNGQRPAKMPRLGPLRPIAQWLVQQVTRWIVRSHLIQNIKGNFLVSMLMWLDTVLIFTNIFQQAKVE